jgi:prefoldin subunit 5
MTDEGVRDLYLKRLREQIEERRSRLEPLRESKKVVQLEDAAQVSLTAEQNTLLADAGIVDKGDLSAITAEIDRLRTEIEAIQALMDAIRAVP